MKIWMESGTFSPMLKSSKYVGWFENGLGKMGLCSDSSPVALVDLLGHDAWPAVYGLTQFSLGILALSHSMFSICI